VSVSFGRRTLDLWPLDPHILYLNHGTVGVTPRRVLATQQAIREEIERQPAQFLLRELADIGDRAPRPEGTRIRAAAGAVAEFLGARGEDLVFADNATTAINAVLRSLPLQAGDEILVTDLAYGAISNAATYVAAGAGATARAVEMPHPLLSADAAVEAIAAELGPRTRLAVIDHITSESALLLPIERIVAACRERGVPVLVDGAHAPGSIALDIPSIGADWYAGNLHKWAWTPRSCGFLWAAPARQRDLHPAVISWGLGLGYTREFDWVGTRDPSPWLAAPDAIAFQREIGVEAIRAWNHGLAWEAGRTLAEAWGTSFETPESMIATMATVALPERMGSTAEDALRLRRALFEEDRIEVQLHAWRSRLWVRVSAQIYVEPADIRRLAEAVLARASVTNDA
jgi:isopenicillin-N epimerase